MSRPVVIQVQDLGKQYRLGQIGTGTLGQDLSRWWHRVRGKEDPWLKIGEEANSAGSGPNEVVWALQHLSFEVAQGDVLGIIGRNGAGKSTLLKILSRTTAPSTGKARIRGRLASLLEVGTGFHPELTGRENIFLNGAIMGMTRREITARFDEILAFTEVERYVDTPVKRYSSGMYVRLAFGVAAHLDPDILIVDEVLAVGDAAFQRKAMGKMKEVSTASGRTVLFVSHNMQAIKSLCTSAMVLHRGRLHLQGSPDACVVQYLGAGLNLLNYHVMDQDAPQAPGLHVLSVGIRRQGAGWEEPLAVDKPSEFVAEIDYRRDHPQVHIGLFIKAATGEVVLSSSNALNGQPLQAGINRVVCRFPAYFFNAGSFAISLNVVEARRQQLVRIEDALLFAVAEEQKAPGEWMGTSAGFFKMKLDWHRELLVPATPQ